MQSRSLPAQNLGTGPTSIVAGDPVPRATAIGGLVAVAAIHLGQVVPTVNQTPYLGVAFVGLTLACVLLAGWLLVNAPGPVWAAVALVNTLAIAGYVFTRTASTFFDNQDVGNWGETLGLVALLIEGSLVVLSLHQLYGERAARSLPSPESGFR
jgi:hypothetical protein